MPLLRMAMYAKGVELYCAPTVDDRETWLPTMRHIACEGRCFVLSANQFARRSRLSGRLPVRRRPTTDDRPDRAAAAASSTRSARCWPARLVTAEAILTADLDLDEIVRGKYDLDVVGHYARPDVFRLIVDRSAREPVSWVSADEAGLDSAPDPVAGPRGNPVGRAAHD